MSSQTAQLVLPPLTSQITLHTFLCILALTILELLLCVYLYICFCLWTKGQAIACLWVPRVQHKVDAQKKKFVLKINREMHEN